MNNPVITLALTILCEIIATTALKLSQGFTRPLPSLVVVIGYGIAFYLLSVTIKNMPLGTAYAIWAGLGTTGTVLIGVFVWNERLDLPRILGIALIVIGVIVLNLFAEGSKIAS
jgi:small multidrug resistance pump